jgi:hypothetical protein
MGKGVVLNGSSAKALGFAVVFLAFISTLFSSVAQAGEQGVLTSTGLTLDGAEATPGKFTAFGFKVECKGTYTGHRYNETPHQVIPPEATTVTVTPAYNECSSFIGETKAPSTVTMNGCDYVVHIGGTLGAGKWATTTDIVCPEGAQVEMHAYTSAAHSSTICTVKVPAQTGLTGGFVTNLAAGKLTLGGPIKGIKATRTGILCGGPAETNAAEEDLDVEVSGTEAGGPAAVEISD